MKRPLGDMSVAGVVISALSESGAMTFRDIVASPDARKYAGHNSENSFYTALSRLMRRKYVERISGGRYALTNKGEFYATKVYVRKNLSDRVSAKQRWDGKWRLVMFDFPESKRPLRDYLRTTLHRVGFIEYQRSVWLYPYKLPAFLEKLFADGEISKHILSMVTFDVRYDGQLRKKFTLE